MTTIYIIGALGLIGLISVVFPGLPKYVYDLNIPTIFKRMLSLLLIFGWWGLAIVACTVLVILLTWFNVL